MEGAHNPAGLECHKDHDGWVLVSQSFDQTDGRWLLGWAEVTDAQAAAATEVWSEWTRIVDHDEWSRFGERVRRDYPPTRWVRALMGLSGSGIRIDGHDDRTVHVNLPASMTAEVEVDEGFRRSKHEVSINLVRDDSGREPRAVVDSVTVARRGAQPVTAGAMRSLRLGDLVDWMMTRAPVVEWMDSERQSGSFLGRGHPAPAEALRAAGRRTGKRGGVIVGVERLAEVANNAPARRLIVTLEREFPGVNRRTLMRALRAARERGLVAHTNRSEAASSAE